ncbi:TIGR02117 family protein [Planctomicrobium sp. SH668]|uniref:TIGR02117 family protein n=1 Tax=Planctomicrobium sp. SH668 TaxID=3448126 RepID=UPI003F5B0C66
MRVSLNSVIGRWGFRIGKWTAYLFLFYVGVILIGLIPVNNDFTPTPDGIEIFITSNAVHSDIIVPVTNAVFDWQTELNPDWFQTSPTRYSHIAIGWGDRGFFLGTPTWNDLKFSTAFNALCLPSHTCLHVAFTFPQVESRAVSVKISADQYSELVEFIRGSFQRDEQGRVIQIPGYSYGQTDAFFEAKGSYIIFNTCNSWVGNALRVSGVHVPWQSTLPKTPTLYLPRS